MSYSVLPPDLIENAGTNLIPPQELEPFLELVLDLWTNTPLDKHKELVT